MPELPDVETIVRELRTRLTRRRVESATVERADVVHGDPRPLGALIAGRLVKTVDRRAKRIIIELTRNLRLVFHLGMSGRLTIDDHDNPIAKHTHVRIGFGREIGELRFRDPRRFGGVWVLTDAGEYVGKRLGRLGPEPLELAAKGFRRILASRRQIKALLLDQSKIAGLGNIYTDEALYAAGVHPMTPADALAEPIAGQLLRAIKQTLRRAIRARGSTLMDYRTVDGQTGSFQRQHRVYGRTGQPCRKCGAPIERIIVAGRSTCFCPRCQPL